MKVCADPVTVTANGSSDVTGTATDAAGNKATATVAGIKIDDVKPTIIFTGVKKGGVDTQGAVPAATCTAADGNLGSGVASCTVAVTGGNANPTLNDQIAAQDLVVQGLETKVAGLLGDLQALDGEISAKETALKGLQADLTAVTAAISAQQDGLRDLESQLDANEAAVEAQEAIILDLQAKNAAVLAQIKAIDAQIALGGCIA